MHLIPEILSIQPKVAICSKYDRQTDKRGFAERAGVFGIAPKPASKKSKDTEDAPAENGEAEEAPPAEEAAAEE